MTFKNSDYFINKINYKTNDLTKIPIKYKTSTNRNFSGPSDREQKIFKLAENGRARKVAIIKFQRRNWEFEISGKLHFWTALSRQYKIHIKTHIRFVLSDTKSTKWIFCEIDIEIEKYKKKKKLCRVSFYRSEPLTLMKLQWTIKVHQ